MLQVKNGTKFDTLYVHARASETIVCAAEDFVNAVAMISGTELSLKREPNFTGEETGLIFAVFSQLGDLRAAFAHNETVLKGDGFCVAERGVFFGANKSNATAHRFESEWKRYGLFGSGMVIEEIANIDFLAKDHPEWFMSALDGGVKTALNGWDSFLNYYNADLAKEFARRLVESVERLGEGNLGHWNMPDAPYFCMIENGVRLHEQPFTADDGTTVYPTDKNYKSTVYFNFLSRVMQEANRLRPNTYLHVFAYTYSEETPAIEVDKRLVITLAPICTNDKYAYSDTEHHDNDAIRDNTCVGRKRRKISNCICIGVRSKARSIPALSSKWSNRICCGLKAWG